MSAGCLALGVRASPLGAIAEREEHREVITREPRSAISRLKLLSTRLVTMKQTYFRARSAENLTHGASRTPSLTHTVTIHQIISDMSDLFTNQA